MVCLGDYYHDGRVNIDRINHGKSDFASCDAMFERRVLYWLFEQILGHCSRRFAHTEENSGVNNVIHLFQIQLRSQNVLIVNTDRANKMVYPSPRYNTNRRLPQNSRANTV